MVCFNGQRQVYRDKPTWNKIIPAWHSVFFLNPLSRWSNVKSEYSIRSEPACESQQLYWKSYSLNEPGWGVGMKCGCGEVITNVRLTLRSSDVALKTALVNGFLSPRSFLDCWNQTSLELPNRWLVAWPADWLDGRLRSAPWMNKWLMKWLMNSSAKLG